MPDQSLIAAKLLWLSGVLVSQDCLCCCCCRCCCCYCVAVAAALQQFMFANWLEGRFRLRTSLGIVFVVSAVSTVWFFLVFFGRSQLAACRLPLVPFLPFYCCLLFVVDDGKSFCQLPAEVLATLTSTSPSTSGMFYAFSYDFTSPLSQLPLPVPLSFVVSKRAKDRVNYYVHLKCVHHAANNNNSSNISN